MKERPILFSAPMVRAILAGTKTQTRRALKPQPQINGGDGLHPVRPYQTPQGKWTWVLASTGHGDGTSGEWCPYGMEGDRFWVRETFAEAEMGKAKAIYYKADEEKPEWLKGFWRPSIFMPRALSRITLEITDVRVERLQEISEEDAIAEGAIITSKYEKSHIEAFCGIWERINGESAWRDNPWVWAITFKHLQGAS